MSTLTHCDLEYSCEVALVRELPVIYVVDNDGEARDSVAALAETLHVSCEAYASGEEFLEHFTPFQPGCAVFELWLSGMNGMQLQQQVAARDDSLSVIFLSALADVPSTVRAMRNGALGVLEKPCTPDVLLDLLREGLESNRRRRNVRVSRCSLRAHYDDLEPRERNAMTLIVRGSPNKAIARALGVSQRTVDRIRAEVLRKMNAETAFELAQMAYELEKTETQ